MENLEPPRGRVVSESERVVSRYDIFGSEADRLAWFNKAVRPALTGALGVALFLMAIMVGTAFGLAAWRAALALPVGDMSLGFAPLAAGVLPVLLHQVTRSMDKRAGVAG